MVQQLARNWWVLTVRGVLAILFGVLAFTWPNITIRVLALLYGAFALLDGCFAVSAALMGGGSWARWWGLVLGGLAGIAIGVITVLVPEVTELFLVILVGAWCIARGVFEIVTAIRLRAEIEGEFWLALSGLVSVLFGAVILFRPVVGEVLVAYLVGAYAIFFGILLVALSFRLRSWHQNLPASAAG
jgi:uncharacterized membrane protein HdeD (DUF308 family)